ncbi:unnamed protein product [Rotaria socialis]|uniref:Cytochrome-b5 reductase n=2 Tax=Rotaria socialis TaxID=392032 RepID=A0A820HEE1_9BILA|nr:unnamed protein product [Rotaria socialis]
MINHRNLLAFIPSHVNDTYSMNLNHLRIIIYDHTVLEANDTFRRSIRKLVKTYSKLTSLIIEFTKRYEGLFRLRNQLHTLFELNINKKIHVYPTAHDYACRFCFDTNFSNEEDDESDETSSSQRNRTFCDYLETIVIFVVNRAHPQDQRYQVTISICGTKIKEQNQIGTVSSTMNYLSLPGQTASTNKPRVQVALAPKHGLMDWIRKTSNTPNLSGTNGKILTITEEELAKHNTKTDCWTAISGHVYNITPYLDYHPGGVDEIMKGAGIDATTLFQDIHSWVNFASMLEKCLVGRLVTSKKEAPSNKSKPVINRLRFDFRQPTSKSLTCFIYTTCSSLARENIFVNIENSKEILVLVYIDGFVHTIAIELLEFITNKFDVRISSNNRSQIEIDLNKQTDQMWKSIGKFLPNHLSIAAIHDFEPIYFTATLIQRTPVTHDTDWYTFSLPSHIFMFPPVGYHVRLRQANEGLIVVKPYTVVRSLNNEGNSSSESTVELLIKHYPDGAMTSSLKKLLIGDPIEMSSYEGTFDVHRIDSCETLILVAAGTGLTPMVRILSYAISQINVGKNIDVFVLFYNKTEKDILCREKLDAISKQYKFTIHHILSQPEPEWTGETGYIKGELLRRLLPPLPQKDSETQRLVCICGPKPFTTLATDLFKENKYNENHLHLFLA